MGIEGSNMVFNIASSNDPFAECTSGSQVAGYIGEEVRRAQCYCKCWLQSVYLCRTCWFSWVPHHPAGIHSLLYNSFRRKCFRDHGLVTAFCSFYVLFLIISNDVIIYINFKSWRLFFCDNFHITNIEKKTPT